MGNIYDKVIIYIKCHVISLNYNCQFLINFFKISATQLLAFLLFIYVFIYLLSHRLPQTFLPHIIFNLFIYLSFSEKIIKKVYFLICQTLKIHHFAYTRSCINMQKYELKKIVIRLKNEIENCNCNLVHCIWCKSIIFFRTNHFHLKNFREN